MKHIKTFEGYRTGSIGPPGNYLGKYRIDGPIEDVIKVQPEIKNLIVKGLLPENYIVHCEDPKDYRICAIKHGWVFGKDDYKYIIIVDGKVVDVSNDDTNSKIFDKIEFDDWKEIYLSEYPSEDIKKWYDPSLKKFEGFNLQKILLDEDLFKQLCQTGYIYLEDDSISISQQQFTDLCEGKFVVSGDYQIALQDIGYDRINNYVKTSSIFN
jgi:hypothetical protein